MTINVDEVADFFAQVGKIIAGVAIVATPLYKKLKKYRSELETANAQNLEQSEAIKELKSKLSGVTAALGLQSAGIMALLHADLYKACAAILERGWVSSSELDDLTKLYDAYHSLGGNGTGTELYNRAIKCAIRRPNDGK